MENNEIKVVQKVSTGENGKENFELVFNRYNCFGTITSTSENIMNMIYNALKDGVIKINANTAPKQKKSKKSKKGK